MLTVSSHLLLLTNCKALNSFDNNKLREISYFQPTFGESRLVESIDSKYGRPRRIACLVGLLSCTTGWKLS